MKKCPYCAEEILDEAIKCRHCGSMVDEKPPQKWYFRPSAVVTAFICVGPIALPLIWFNPGFSRKTKVVLTGIVLALTYYLFVLLAASLKSINQYYQQIFR